VIPIEKREKEKTKRQEDKKREEEKKRSIRPVRLTQLKSHAVMSVSNLASLNNGFTNDANTLSFNGDNLVPG